MTRYGLAFVITRSFAVAIWWIALNRVDYVIWGAMRLFTAVYSFEPLVYFVIPLLVCMLGLVIWWTSGSIAKRIAGIEPNEPVEGLSTDEAVLMRVVFSGMGVFILIGFLMRVPQIIVPLLVPPSVDRATLLSSPSLEFTVQTAVMLICGLILLFGSKPLASIIMRLRKFD